MLWFALLTYQSVRYVGLQTFYVFILGMAAEIITQPFMPPRDLKIYKTELRIALKIYIKHQKVPSEKLSEC